MKVAGKVAAQMGDGSFGRLRGQVGVEANAFEHMGTWLRRPAR
jgi:hypothetical protein